MTRGCNKSMLHSNCFIGAALRDVVKNDGFGRIEMYFSGAADWRMSMLQANMPTDVQMRPLDAVACAEIGKDRDGLFS
jgi:hypothetical protein